MFIEDDIEVVKKKLKEYTPKKIIFNEPHFTHRLFLRSGCKKDVIQNLISPENLIFSYHLRDKFNSERYILHFKTSRSRTMILPVIFNKGNKKN